MADLSDVQNVLVGAIAPALYPNGTAQAPAIGAPCRVGAGWPTEAMLDADLAAGIVNVSVYAAPFERKTTRYLQKSNITASASATVTLSVAGDTVTVGGTLPTPAIAQNVVVIIAGKPYLHPVQANDTLASIAAALATLISADYPGTTSSAAVITIASTLPVIARAGGTATMSTETRRQNRAFRVVIWAPTPTLRDAAVNIIDPMFSAIDFLTMPDGFGARLLYQGTTPTDLQERANLYRRDLIYTVEYATTVSTQVGDVIAPAIATTNPVTGAVIKTTTY